MTINRRHLLQALAAAPVAAATLPAAANASAQASAIASAPSAFHRFKIGEATVTALLDGHLPLGTQLIPDFDADKASSALKGTLYQFKDSSLQVPVNGYLVEHGGTYTLVDTGGTPQMSPALGGLHSALAAAGVTPEQISTVVMTHLHPDHTGGLLLPDGSAAFANAELVVSEVEWGFWHDDAILAGVPKGSQGFFHAARMSVAPYKDRLKLIKGEAEAAPGLTAVPLPGHTPGHTGFMLDGGSESLLIWGDLVHMTALQFTYPDWTITFDTDAQQTATTRRQMMDRAVVDNLLVTGMHLDFPGLGQVKRAGEGYRYQAAPWQFGQ
ncbi:MBL fold metallo-hydrolase [Pseudophaeobacter leonis]|uniref:MBL fold metallo-hydrolase n=1 Tax=Pseudophaeobacter leonis TaxID=1144477 RepID=UPI0009F4BB62|nr:MBL fold metallo-hydrolase [Pseudophaeobacter leonis]